eukprot:7521610-Karenia_brevis.AAC.1
MRVLRRADGCIRAVRKQLQHPSIDCWLRRARQRYLARLLTSGPRALMSLLAHRAAEKIAPWTKLILEDLMYLRETCKVPDWLGDPRHYGTEWGEYIRSQPEQWHEIVQNVSFYESVVDELSVVGQNVAGTFICDMCP